MSPPADIWESCCFTALIFPISSSSLRNEGVHLVRLIPAPQGMSPHTFLRRAFSLSRADSRRASLRRNDSSVTVLMISLFFLYGDG
ncbi:hypothetical protein BVU_1588 [Phocaeicola vulgatus ATCC 8482]|uniref:Uncharacterized protein n=1 Tax=Phocaeicola vulgatus (strain ATCC 8482 / DSM 1447 / JCM 5826 / CCUG 4940 / NBRC 14291 / NCTC 11154) TaxID=435590 RepID=A6L0R1_PHOV8|nr:hypothetical protein BVU_1588 [Phocaeicola vulgatus ATCC 8482]